eukprot:3197237-Prymnesium_polylepis.1
MASIREQCAKPEPARCVRSVRIRSAGHSWRSAVVAKMVGGMSSTSETRRCASSVTARYSAMMMHRSDSTL